MWIFSPRRCSSISTRAVVAPRSKPSSSTAKARGRSTRAAPVRAYLDARRPGAEVEALVVHREADRELDRVPDLTLHAVEDQLLALPHPVLFSAALYNRKHPPLLELFKRIKQALRRNSIPPGDPRYQERPTPWGSWRPPSASASRCSAGGRATSRSRRGCSGRRR